jgi:hypothetical protein
MTSRMTAAATLAALLALCAWACQPDQPCDPDQVHVGSLCYAVPAPVDAGDSGPADAGSDAGPDGGGLCSAPDGGFGAACTDVAQCPCGLDFCVAFSGFDYCTRKGCLADPSICPAGWVCTDLSAYGQPAVCFKP